MGQMFFVDVVASSLWRPLWILDSPVSERMCGLQFEQGRHPECFAIPACWYWSARATWSLFAVRCSCTVWSTTKLRSTRTHDVTGVGMNRDGIPDDLHQPHIGFWLFRAVRRSRQLRGIHDDRDTCLHEPRRTLLRATATEDQLRRSCPARSTSGHLLRSLCMSRQLLSSTITPVTAVSYASPAPKVNAAPAPDVEHIPPAPAVNYAFPAPITEVLRWCESTNTSVMRQ